MSLRSVMKGGVALLILAGLLSASWPASAAQRKRARRARASTTSSVVNVPRIKATSNVNATSVPSLSSPNVAATQTPSPTPRQTPTPQPATPAGETLDDDDEVVRVTSNLVVVPVSVTNAAGEPVQGLKLEDFRLEEEGRAQQIAQVGDADQVPLDIALLFDVSSSVTARDFFTFQQEAAARFLRQVLKPSDRAAVFTIGMAPRMEQALASADTATAKIKTIPPAKVSTGTAFYDTVVAAAKYLAANAPGRHRRVILAITDGDDTYSGSMRDASAEQAKAILEGKEVEEGTRAKLRRLHDRAVRDVLREVQRADAVFYSINPSGPSIRLNEISSRAQDGMRLVADATGGYAFVPERVDSLEAVLRRIAAELRAQYLLQYYPTNEAPPGKYLTIKVATPARSDLRVRARQGYYSAKPK